MLLKKNPTKSSEPQSKQSATTATSTYLRLALSHWRANIDFQVILDWDQAVRYMVKYVSKGMKRPPATADVFARAISRADDDTDEAAKRLPQVYRRARHLRPGDGTAAPRQQVVFFFQLRARRSRPFHHHTPG